MDKKQETKVKFEIIKSETIKIGNYNFLEVAQKKAITSTGETLFMSLSRGFTTPNGEKRYSKSFTIPLEENVLKFVSEKIIDLSK